MPANVAPCTTDQPTLWIANTLAQRQCPLRRQSAYNWLLQSYVDYHHHHHLPRSGGSLEQPAWIMDAINLIAGVMVEDSDSLP